MINRILQRLAAGASLLTLAACGGTGTTGNSVAGVEGTGARQGTISGFGSVYVNGAQISTVGAAVVIDGIDASENDLLLGMNVLATVSNDGAEVRASRIEYNRYLSGPVEDVNADENTVTILSQTVLLSNTTVLNNFSNSGSSAGLNALEPMNNDWVSVSGFVDDQGQVVATLLDLKAQPYDRQLSVFDLEGSVSNHNPNSQQFQIGALLVDYSTASVDERVGALANGAIVEVFGTQLNFQGVLLASEVRVITRQFAQQGQTVSLEGVITENNTPNQFSFSDQIIATGNANRQDNSSDSPQLGSRVQVLGKIDDSGVLQAQSLTLVPLSNKQLGGDITLLPNEQLEIFGNPIQATASTIYLDSSSAANRRLRYSSLANGDALIVTGYLDNDNLMVATAIQRIDSDGEALVRGELQVCNAVTQELQIANVLITTDGDTTFQRDGRAESMVEFCARTSIGSIVSARGQQNGNSLHASVVTTHQSGSASADGTTINLGIITISL